MLYWIICVAQFCQLLEHVIVLFCCDVVENLHVLSIAMEESCFLNFFLRQYLKQWKLHAILNNLLCCTVLSAVRTCYCIILLWCCWKSSHIIICHGRKLLFPEFLLTTICAPSIIILLRIFQKEFPFNSFLR